MFWRCLFFQDVRTQRGIVCFLFVFFPWASKDISADRDFWLPVFFSRFFRWIFSVIFWVLLRGCFSLSVFFFFFHFGWIAFEQLPWPTPLCDSSFPLFPFTISPPPPPTIPIFFSQFSSEYSYAWCVNAPLGFFFFFRIPPPYPEDLASVFSVSSFSPFSSSLRDWNNRLATSRFRSSFLMRSFYAPNSFFVANPFLLPTFFGMAFLLRVTIYAVEGDAIPSSYFFWLVPLCRFDTFFVRLVVTLWIPYFLLFFFP